MAQRRSANSGTIGAVILLALSIACVGVALWAGQRSAHIQGPSTLGALPDGSVWLVVDADLWLLGPNGQKFSQQPWSSTSLPASPATLAYRASTQELYAMSRGSPVVEVLHPRTAAPLRRITLQWPAAFQTHLGGGLWLAVHEDGRMAVATGSGHAVLLFDDAGKHLATTRPGTYRYTNDLWWDMDQLWTTDTNGQALVLLDGQTLKELRRLPLNSEHPWRFTALAKPHPHAGISALAPRATLSRLDGQMRLGRVVQVWADGREEELKLGPQAEPVDLCWAGDTLLVVDAHDWRIRRFDTLNQGLSDFGSDAVRAALADLRREKRQFKLLNRAGVSVAVGLLVAGLLWALWARRQREAGSVAQAAAQARFLGTPLLPRGQLVAGALSVFWPMLVLIAILVMLRALIAPEVAMRLGKTGMLVGVTAGMLVWTLLALAMPWWWRRCAARPELESVMNAQPVMWLLRSADWSRVALPGEHVRETWLLRHWRGGRWMVLTNQRLLAFKVSGLGRRSLEQAWSRKQIRKVQRLEWSALTWRERLSMYAFIAGVMRIQLQDGTVVQGGLLSPTTAARVQAQLNLRNHLMHPGGPSDQPPRLPPPEA
jgi:hypothetical protein